METSYEIEFNNLVRQIKAYNSNFDVDFLRKICNFSYEAHDDRKRKSGELYFQHCLEVAKILINLRLDPATIASGLLHDVIEDTDTKLQKTTLPEIEEKFGAEVALLIEGVNGIHRLKKIGANKKPNENYIEDYIKMLLSVVKDIRVILIKLADRLHDMRTLKYLPEKIQQEIVKETKEIYVPLANRLGVSKIKSELEDLVFKFLDNDRYKDLAQKVNEKRQHREQYTQSFASLIHEKLLNNGIQSRVEGRPKSLYSIYRKSKNLGIPFEEIYDLFAIRIIVVEREDCDRALKVVHDNFEYLKENFRDYIKLPKPNGYKSLHTVILSNENRYVEIQIRTEEMHKIAEDGIAAHWKYKEGKLDDSKLDKYLVDFRQWLRQLAELLEEAKDSKEILEHLKIDLFKDEILVYTPEHEVITLPNSSTPVDFAFAVHTEIGLHCIGAKVNSKLVPLEHKLKSGETIEILTGTKQKPNPDWLKFVRTSKARSKIKHWIKETDLPNQLRGEKNLQEQLKQFNINKDEIDLEEIAQIFGLSNAIQLYSAIGYGDISVQQVVHKIAPKKRETESNDDFPKKILSKVRSSANGVRVQGLDNLLIKFGECCRPVPDDRIIGFITNGQGIVIHRSDCYNVLTRIINSDRNIDAEWGIGRDKPFMSGLQMLGKNRKDFLRDVSDAITKMHIKIVSVNLNTNDTFIQGYIIIKVENSQQLTRVINRLRKVNGVLNVERLDGAGEPVADLVSDVSSVWNKAN